MNRHERFSNRVDAYVKYRPGYPKTAMDCLYDTVGLSADSEIADIGAGTGIMSRLLLERGSRVTAIEPNDEMREVAEERLSANLNFRAFPCSAEDSGLTDETVDAIVCAQSFHWFNPEAAAVEFRRILRPHGKVVLIWNTRLTEGSPFMEAYESLLQRYGTDYAEVNHKNISRETLTSFFKEGSMQEARFPNLQIFDFEGLCGRLSSSSYAPQPEHSKYEPMMSELRDLFDRHAQNGQVYFKYETELMWGQL